MSEVVVGPGDSAVVLGAALASMGKAVRVLVTSAVPIGRSTGGAAAIGPAERWVALWPGAQLSSPRERWFLDGELRTAPRRRREIVRRSGWPGLLASPLTGRARTLEGALWLGFGPGLGATLADYTERRLGVGAASLDPSVGGLLWGAVGERAALPSVDPALLIARIGVAGGEVIEDVEAIAIELEEGRAVAVETELGREWLEGPLWWAGTTADLGELLPEPHRTLFRGLSASTRVTRGWCGELRLAAPVAEVGRVHWLDPGPFWAVDLLGDRLVAQLSADGVPGWDERRALLEVARALGLESLGAPRFSPSVAVAAPLSSGRGDRRLLAEAATRLGIVLVGGLAHGVPMSRGAELEEALALAQGLPWRGPEGLRFGLGEGFLG